MADANERTPAAHDDSIRDDISEHTDTFQRVRHEGCRPFYASRDKATAAASSTNKDYGVRGSVGVARTTTSSAPET